MTARSWQSAVAMQSQLTELLSHLHQSIDRLAADLMRDRPDLALALRVQTASIPRPEELRPLRPPVSARVACDELRPLLYRALEEGVVDAKGFDRLMLKQNRAARALRQRR
jgi:hypothetical protein